MYYDGSLTCWLMQNCDRVLYSENSGGGGPAFGTAVIGRYAESAKDWPPAAVVATEDEALLGRRPFRCLAMLKTFSLCIPCSLYSDVILVRWIA